MGYRHFQIAQQQSAKYPDSACGDVVDVRRSSKATLLVCADGIGSGIKANLAATMAISRLLGLVEAGYSLREAFATLARTMNQSRDPSAPFAAFTIARFLPNGETTILSYEMPPPVLLSAFEATALRQHSFDFDGASVYEANCYLDPGEGLLIVSDGITQSGLGNGFVEGWTLDNVRRFVRDHLVAGTPLADMPRLVHDQARANWGDSRGDDCTAALAICRKGQVVTLFTGPPANRHNDYAATGRFLKEAGLKAVCGASTAQIVSRYLGKPLKVSEDSLECIAPPYYSLEGIDLVTEGAVTLNQVYNILEENPAKYEPNSGVSKLSECLRAADRVNIFLGGAENEASEDISFRQQGILPRASIVPLLARKLEEWGKLVVVERV